MRTFQPMTSRVLLKGLTLAQVERIIVPRKRLIEAPEVARKIPQLFEVVAVGPDTRVLAPGDTVAMSEYLGTKLEFDGEEYIVAMEADVLGVIREGADPSQRELPLGATAGEDMPGDIGQEIAVPTDGPAE